MQANKDQNWTDDADFWDEAWADMNTRLDAKPNRRKGFLAWWPFYLGVAAFIALAMVLGSRILTKQETIIAAASPPSVIAEISTNSDLGTEAQPVAAAEATEPGSTNLKNEDEKVVVSANPTNSAKNSKGETSVFRVRKTLGAEAITSTFDTPIKGTKPSVVTNDRSTINSLVEASAPEVSSPPAGNFIIPVQVEEDREVLPPSLPLATLPIAQLPTGIEYTTTALPIERKRYRNPLMLDAAYTSSFNLQQPGFLVGLSYRIKNDSKLSFPISLRYRLDRLAIDLTSTTADRGDAGSGNTYLSPLFLSTDAVEVGAGMAWAATPRLRFSTGLSVAYQLRALVNFEGQSPTGFNSQAEDSNEQFFSVEYDRSINLLSGLRQDGVGPELSRWMIRGNAGVAYDIKPRFGVSLKATHLLIQPDRADVINLQAGRFEVGFSYRFR